MFTRRTWDALPKCCGEFRTYKVEASIPVNLRIFKYVQMHVELKIFTVA